MKSITTMKYQCEICGEKFVNADEAIECEAKFITQDNVEIGDMVLILNGDCQFQICPVIGKRVIGKYYGRPYQIYWHTMMVIADTGHGVTRFLTFNDYKKVS